MMHVLGNKHKPPAAFELYWENTRGEVDAPYRFVSLCTWGEEPDSSARQRQEYVRNLSTDLADAYSREELKFLISTKHPRPWAASVARQSGWTLAEPSGILERMRKRKTKITMREQYADRLEAACRDYNSRNRSWLELYERFPNRSEIVHHEDLLEDPLGILRKLASKFGLSFSGDRVVVPTLEVQAPEWDNDPLMFGDEPFDPAVYRKKKYRDQLSRVLWDIVERTIDWELAAQFGYRK
jgi:hypothetical protein